MGDAADDAFNAALHETENQIWLLRACRSRKDYKPTDKCRWYSNDDGLYECARCGEVADV